ncbi:hypothetical protein GGS26DRAFT_96313 [Hypomontagnella submonticulosa]|nr:hypothetical protein GGS26DRAFT_96313 [Hypomontagnella submonticulosa]
MSHNFENRLDGPALQPPIGEVPNFQNPWNLNSIGHFTNAICLLSSTFVVVLRMLAKLSSGKKFEIEDALILACMGTYCGSIWCSYHIISTAGLFTHQWDIRLRDLPSLFYVHHVGSNLIATTLSLGKAAILIEWSRIFVPRGTRDSFYWICKAVLAFSSIGNIAYIVAENMSCFPHKRIWDKTILEGYCIDSEIFQIPGALINPICIAFIIALPQRAIWRLNMSSEKKIGVSLLFLVGLLALGSSIARLVETFKYLHSTDKTFTISNVYLWCLAEMTCNFLAICAPWSPKAFAKNGPISHFMTSFRIRVGQSRSQPSLVTKSHSWPSQKPPAVADYWDVTGTYHRMKDTIVPLVRYPSATSANEQRDDITVPRGAILMTTEITVATNHAAGDPSNQDYPWTT